MDISPRPRIFFQMSEVCPVQIIGALSIYHNITIIYPVLDENDKNLGYATYIK